MSRKTPVPGDRGHYKDGHERVARVDVRGDLAHITNLRDSIFPAMDEIETRWVDETFDLRELTNLWVFVGYFSGFRGIAHVELGFEFAHNRNLVASFEIRPLEGQRFGVVDGLKKSFEITVRWGTERDMMLQRFNRSSFKTDLYMLEADITYARMIDVFQAAGRRTNKLNDEPEWYNAKNNACAGNAVDLVNEVLPGHVRKTRKVILPGLMPKFWAKQGVIKLHGTFEETMERARINDRCLEIGNAEDFSAQLHGRV